MSYHLLISFFKFLDMSSRQPASKKGLGHIYSWLSCTNVHHWGKRQSWMQNVHLKLPHVSKHTTLQ